MNDAEYLISCLLEILKTGCDIPPSDEGQFRLFSDLCRKIGGNIPKDEYFYEIQDRYLQTVNRRQIISGTHIIPESYGRCCVLKSTPAAIETEAVVNAAGERMLGYFTPCFECIENEISARAGLQLRRELSATRKIAGGNGGSTIITGAYNLPAKYIIHPRTLDSGRPVQSLDPEDIQISYRNCLHLAWLNGICSVAFCTTLSELSRYTKFEVADIIALSVKEWLYENPNYDIKVIFCVFTDEDVKIFEDALKRH